MLRMDNISVHYGAIAAVEQANLTLAAGQIVAVIGANGAGKSSLLMSLFNQPRPVEGTVWFEGVNLTRLPTHRIGRLGIACVPEGRRIFPRMSVLENLQMGAIHQPKTHWQQDLEQVTSLFPVLASRLGQMAGTLSGGEQQMVAIARALVARPRLLVLDEPSLGLAPIIVQQIFAALRQVNRQGISLLLVEQNAHLALQLADQAYVMQTGRMVMQGSADSLRQNPHVQQFYLGMA
ncbi:MAG: ABC transporter ATP-binding protein [Alphaproteobacteria bacterium]|nr:ABC transporter ATP-binding protein [Alphaproteobacteria bacterium]